jgi:neprosin-like protein
MTSGALLLVAATMSGYYPAYFFGSGQLTQYATRVMFGGEILQEESDTTLPTVSMGSSAGKHPWYTPSPLCGNVAYQPDLQVMNLSGALRDFSPNADYMAPNANMTGYPRGCAYGLAAAGRFAPFVSGWGYSIFFGGDGIGGTKGC